MTRPDECNATKTLSASGVGAARSFVNEIGCLTDVGSEPSLGTVNMAELLISDDDLDVLLDAANPVELASLDTVAITRALVALREVSLAPVDSPAPTRRRRRVVTRMRLVEGSVAVVTPPQRCLWDSAVPAGGRVPVGWSLCPQRRQPRSGVSRRSPLSRTARSRPVAVSALPGVRGWRLGLEEGVGRLSGHPTCSAVDERQRHSAPAKRVHELQFRLAQEPGDLSPISVRASRAVGRRAISEGRGD